MNEPNIIKQDLGKVKKFFLPMREGFIEFLVFLLRWMLSTTISAMIIRALNIHEYIISKWLNPTLILGACLIYFMGFIFHQTYNLEKEMKEQRWKK
jgi:hypothetical protein